jgi:hypothetical protein
MRGFFFAVLYKSRGLGQAKPEPGPTQRLWPGLCIEKAKAISSQAKAGAFRPSRAGTTLPPIACRYDPIITPLWDVLAFTSFDGLYPDIVWAENLQASGYCKHSVSV